MKLTENLEIITRERMIKALQMVSGYEVLGKMFRNSHESWSGDVLALVVEPSKKDKDLLVLMNEKVQVTEGRAYLRIFGGKVINDRLLKREVSLVSKYFEADEKDIFVIGFEDCNIKLLTEEAKAKLIMIPGLKSTCWEPYYSQMKSVLSIKGRRAQ